MCLIGHKGAKLCLKRLPKTESQNIIAAKSTDMSTYANIKHLKYALKNLQHYSPHHEILTKQ